MKFKVLYDPDVLWVMELIRADMNLSGAATDQAFKHKITENRKGTNRTKYDHLAILSVLIKSDVIKILKTTKSSGPNESDWDEILIMLGPNFEKYYQKLKKKYEPHKSQKVNKASDVILKRGKLEINFTQKKLRFDNGSWEYYQAEPIGLAYLRLLMETHGPVDCLKIGTVLKLTGHDTARDEKDMLAQCYEARRSAANFLIKYAKMTLEEVKTILKKIPGQGYMIAD